MGSLNNQQEHGDPPEEIQGIEAFVFHEQDCELSNIMDFKDLFLNYLNECLFNLPLLQNN